MIKKLSIIIAAYNEGKTIHLILDKVNNVNLINNIEKEIIIVNDCSIDNTEEAVMNYISIHSALNIIYYKHDVNKGKGAALRTGISKATGEYLIIQDADLEYDPHEYNDLLKPVINGFADVVFGSRFMGGNPHRILFFWHTIGNKFLTTLSNMFTNLNLTDMETCYKLFNTKIIQSISLKEERFGFEPEITAKISQIPKIRIYEVGISYYGRTYDEGKKIGWRDGMRALYCILRYNAHNSKISLQFLVYLFIGGISALFNLLLFLLLTTKLTFGISAIIAFYSAASLNYWLSTKLLFIKNIRWRTWSEYVIYFIVVSSLAVVDLFTTKGLITIDVAPAIAKIIATGIGFVFNFLVRRYIVFPEK
jgi:glycosyltransferase involved in cell wall biosynthesis